MIQRKRACLTLGDLAVCRQRRLAERQRNGKESEKSAEAIVAGEPAKGRILEGKEVNEKLDDAAN